MRETCQNFVVLTAVLSWRPGLYSAGGAMGNEGMIPRWFAARPSPACRLFALCAAMAGGLLALLSSVIAASTVPGAGGASSLSAVVVWIAIACAMFRRR